MTDRFRPGKSEREAHQADVTQLARAVLQADEAKAKLLAQRVLSEQMAHQRRKEAQQAQLRR